MRKAALGVVVVYAVLLSSLTFAQDNKAVDTFPLNKIQAGMHGVAYTVFQGTKPEAMDVEVLGILKNANGPKGDVILVRLGGAKAEYTGVVAGMSGSPGRKASRPSAPAAKAPTGIVPSVRVPPLPRSGRRQVDAGGALPTAYPQAFPRRRPARLHRVKQIRRARSRQFVPGVDGSKTRLRVLS